MAAPYITANTADSNATHAHRLLSYVSQTKTLRSGLTDLIAEIYQMLDGDGSNVSHYTLVATKLGVPSTAAAKEVFDLANGLLAAINGSNDANFAKRIG